MTTDGTIRPGKQQVIIYDRDGRERAYGTAYDDTQAADVMKDCEARYGKAAKPRSVYGAEWTPGKRAA